MRHAAVFLLLASRLAAETPSTAAPGAQVVLPVEAYRALRDAAYPPSVEPARPPLAATSTRIEYDLRVAGDSASGTAHLTTDVLAEGWVKVPVPPGLHIASARLDGRAVGIVEAAGAAPFVLVSQPGRTVLALEITVPISAGSGTESLTLPSGGAAVTRAVIAVPRSGVDVVLGGAVLTEKTDGKDATRWVAYGSGGASLVFSWRRKAEDRRSTLPLRLRANVVEHVGFGEESAQVTADVRVEVVQGSASKLSLVVPDGLVIHQVAGANVADWDARDGRLSIGLLDATESGERVTVTGEARCPREGAVSVPLLRVADVERETGGLAIEVLGAGEVTSQAPRGMDPGDVSDLGEGLGGRGWGLVVPFRFRPLDAQAPRSLAVTLARYTPQAVLMASVEEARYQALATADGKTLVRARYAVRNNAQTFLVARLPEGATLWSAAVGGRAVRPGRSAEGAFLLPLEKTKAGEEAPPFLVELVYLERGPAWAPSGRTRLSLPALDLPVSRTAVVLHHAPQYRLTFDAGALLEQPFRGPSSPALRFSAGGSPAAEAGADKKSARDEMQGFVDRAAQVAGGRRTSGILPIEVPFPAMGPAVFLASELTKEGEAPFLDIAYRSSKGGR
jgi:hypothetical protein